MKKYILSVFCLLTLFAQAQILEPIHWTAGELQVTDSLVELQLTATIDKDWHLYSTELPDGGPKATTFIVDGATVLELVPSQMPQMAYDENFGMMLSYFEKQVDFSLRLLPEPDKALSVAVEYMACNDMQCLPPTTYTFFENASLSSQNEDVSPVNGTAQPGLWMIFLMGLLGGFLAIFTPCVWPIIPMTVSFFLKRDKTKSGWKDAMLYGLAIIIIYVGLGLLITLIFGASALNSLSTNAVVNLLFFVLLVVFAISFFGAFELTLPASWSTRLDAKASKTTGFLSILLMAFTLVIVSFSCTGPIIGTLLVEAAGRSLLAPAVGMSGFAIALALPFSIFALFPQWLHRMPKSGGWMNTFKVTLAFLELALSLKFFSVADLAYGWHLMDREVFLALWIVIFALLGVYLLGGIRFKHDGEKSHTSVTRLMLAIISLAFAVYMVPGLWGAPLKAISAFAPPLTTQDFILRQGEQQNHTFSSYEEALQQAKRENKSVLLDFSGYGCVNCRKMEAKVLSDERVVKRLQNYVVVTLYVDDKTPLESPLMVTENGKEKVLKTVGDKWSYLQRTEFKANAQPFYIQLDADGKPVSGSYAYNENAEDFLNWLIQ